MRAIQMTFDESLIQAVDHEASLRGTSRSAFVREVLKAWLAGIEERRLEQQHIQGYERHPVQPGEFDLPDSDRAWGN